MNCLPVKIQDCLDAGYRRCVKCGRLFLPGDDQQQECPTPNSQKQPVQLPPFLATAARYVQSYAKQRAAGDPIVPLSQVIARFRICSACEQYNDQVGKCGICGCFVNLLHNGQGQNKLEWGTSECPSQPPKWLKIE